MDTKHGRVVRLGSALGVVFAICAMMAGCKSKESSPGASKEQERLLKKAFAAIEDNDWEAYSHLTITTSDFSMERQGITGFKKGESYQGSVLKPEQEKKQKAQFEKAVAGGEGIIDFKNAKFVSAGGFTAKGTQELVSGGEIAVTSCFLRIKVSGEKKAREDLAPLFNLVDWKGVPRILALAFAE